MDGLKFFHSFLKKLLSTGFAVLFLGIVALHEGAGYETIRINSKNIRIIPWMVDIGGVGGMRGFEVGTGGILYICIVNVSLNPFLYPLSYLLWNGKSSCTSTAFAYPLLWDKSHEAMDSAKFRAVFPEFLRNLPYISLIGFLIELLVEKLYRKSCSKLDLVEESIGCFTLPFCWIFESTNWKFCFLQLCYAPLTFNQCIEYVAKDVTCYQLSKKTCFV